MEDITHALCTPGRVLGEEGGEGVSHMTHKIIMKEASAHTAGVEKTEAGARLDELYARVPPEQERKLRWGKLT